MLRVSNLSKYYGDQTILSDLSFIVNKGERVGLVGPNGCGKTTLMRIIVGLEQPEQGQIGFDPAALSVGYLPQALQLEEGETVQQALDRFTAAHSQARTDMQHYAELMGETGVGSQLSELGGSYAEAELRFEAAGGYELEARLEAVLSGLELADVPRHSPVEHLSGGQKTRLGLAGLLTHQPELLLLDEPTNHLDIDALDWLENWLPNYDGAMLIVSHDRTFLDAITTRTLVIDPVTHSLRDIAGNYTFYLETLAREVEQQWREYHQQQEEITHLQRAARRLRGLATFKRGGKADTSDKFAKAFFANRSAGTVGRAKQIERRLERLLTEEQVEKPKRRWALKVDLAENESGGRQVLTIDNVAMEFDKRVLFSQVKLTLTQGQRVVLVGPNGTGKTTLVRIIAGELSPSSGEVRLGAGVKLGYVAQEQEILDPNLTPYDTIRAVVDDMTEPEVRSFLHFFLFAGDDVFVKISNLSFGERARLMLALLVARGCNFLLLDEPINHLDIASREHFEAALDQFPGTVLAVVHDRAFIRRFATGIWELRDGRVRELTAI